MAVLLDRILVYMEVMNMALLEVKNLKKVYTTRFTQNQVQALTNVNFSVNKGEYVAILHYALMNKLNNL